MSTQSSIDYQRIEEAIHFIKKNFKSQPSLDEIAATVHLSPFHFQRMFNEWAGISPKKFVQYISVQYAKSLLQKPQNNLFITTMETGLSSTSRLHDLFVTIEGMTPAEYKNGGQNLTIEYSINQSMFGNVCIASTPIGICHIAFFTHKENAIIALKNRFPNAIYLEKENEMHLQVTEILKTTHTIKGRIHLHIHGTPFQVKIWESLLKIPFGELTTYGQIASNIEKPNASRAVGTAIGSNPVAYLIPCHRVIQSSGSLGGYMWGEDRKSAIIGWEAAQINYEK